MGLAICRSIVEAHGGQLGAEANQPRGAVFRFMLPAGEDAIECPGAKSPSPARSRRDAPQADFPQV